MRRPPMSRGAPTRERELRLALVIGALLLPSLMHASGAATMPDVEVLSPVLPIPAKERVTTFFLVGNDGPGDLREVRVTARPLPGSDITVVGQIERELDDIPAGDAGLLALQLSTGERSGGAPIEISVAFTDADGVRRSVSREVNVQIGPPRSDALLIEYVPDPLTTGSDGLLRFIVRNPSSRTFIDVDLDLVVAQPGSVGGLGSLFGRTTVSADLTAGGEGTPLSRGALLGPASVRTVEAPVRVSRSAGDLLAFSVTARYTLDGFERTQRFDFGARVEGSVALRILEAREEVVGDRLFLTGTIVNVGTGTAWNPRVRIPNGTSYAQSPSALISDLKPNDAVTFQLVTSREYEGSIASFGPLIEVEWNDDFGQISTKMVDALPVPADRDASGFAAVLSNAARSRWTLPLTVLGVIAAIVIGGQIRRRRLEAEDDA